MYDLWMLFYTNVIKKAMVTISKESIIRDKVQRYYTYKKCRRENDRKMIRRVFKTKKKRSGKIDAFIDKYKIPREYLSINRKSVSRAVLVGLFWGFIPMPMQMLAVLATTPFLRFNVPVAISMVWLSNPVTMPPMYYMEYLTGNFILGREGVGNVEMTVQWFKDNLGDIFVPLYVGTAFYSIVVSFLVYLLVNRLWIYSVKKEKHKKEKIRKDLHAKKRKHKGQNQAVPRS
jgi:uncharacterized protein (DUF2062 family)